jgi:hypothetical protein
MALAAAKLIPEKRKTPWSNLLVGACMNVFQGVLDDFSVQEWVDYS